MVSPWSIFSLTSNIRFINLFKCFAATADTGHNRDLNCSSVVKLIKLGYNALIFPKTGNFVQQKTKDTASESEIQCLEVEGDRLPVLKVDMLVTQAYNTDKSSGVQG